MSEMPWRIILLGAAMVLASPFAFAGDPAELESDLIVNIDGTEKTLPLGEAMAALNVPAVSIALIDQDQIAFARAYGERATPETLFQAASLSKFVAAVGAMRLVEQKKLDLDADVNAELSSWKLPESPFDKDKPVTLRGLLSMTAGIGVPGFIGYARDAKLPTLVQILDGTPPANSPPVTAVAPPGNYRYSGGGYEIVEAMMSDAAGAPFPALMGTLVLNPAEMSHSTFAQPLPAELENRAALGHTGDGKESPGGWRVIPEHAAGGLWSTPTGLANLLLLVGRAWRAESRLFLLPETAREMLTPQNGGPYGLGAAIRDADGSLIVLKRGQNVGYKAYLVLLPAEGKGMVVMTNSDNGSILADSIFCRSAAGAATLWFPSQGSISIGLLQPVCRERVSGGHRCPVGFAPAFSPR